MSRVESIKVWAKRRLEVARADYPLVDIAVRTFKRYSEDEGGPSAAALTYYFFFSIFPLLLFVGSLLGLITFISEDIKADLLKAGLEAAPLMQDVLNADSLEALQDKRSQLAIVALVMALYAGSGVIVALEHALNKINRCTLELNFIQKRLRSFRFMGLFAVGALVSLSLSALGRFIGSLDALGPAGGIFGSLVAYAGAIAVTTGLFAACYKLLPACDLSWRDVLPGAITAALTFEVLKWAGGVYLAQGEATRNNTFGAFATAAALLVVSYLLSQVTLLAAELNAVIVERRRLRGRL
jgi:YihY family inner membrane protein